MTQLRFAPAPLPTDSAPLGGSTTQVTHLLALSDYLDPSDIEFLFQCRESRATWETLPQELVDGDVVEIVPGTIRLSPHAVLHGPYSPLVLAPESDSEYVAVETGAVTIDSQGLMLDTGVLHLDQNLLAKGPSTQPHPADFPLGATMVWALTCVRARGEEPFPAGDHDGLARVFAEGMPIRDELRQVTSLVAVARYLEGSVHFDALGGNGAKGLGADAAGVSGVASGAGASGASGAGAGATENRYRTVVPDPAANVDLTVYSDVWLDPQAALRLAHLVAPTAQFMPTEVEWAGPVVEELEADSPLSPELVAEIHEFADRADKEALETPQEHTAYGLVYEAAKGDIIAVEVAGSTELPPILENIEWAQDGVIEYRLTWVPSDLEDWQREIPSFELRQRRTRAIAIVRALAKSVYSATAGEVVDQDGFLCDPATL